MLMWIVVGLVIWMALGVLAVAVACAASRGDRLSAEAAMGVDPALELAPRRRMAIDVTPVTRPWAAAAAATGSAVVASVAAAE
jgi:hypothetical protein